MARRAPELLRPPSAHQLVEELPAQPEADAPSSTALSKIFGFASPEQVPGAAARLAAAGFLGAAAFFAAGLAGLALAAAGGRGRGGSGRRCSRRGPAALRGEATRRRSAASSGSAAAGSRRAGAAGAAAAALAPHAFAEHDAWPAGRRAGAGAFTSLALTGGGVAPPQATRALAPSAARTAAMFSNDRLGRVWVACRVSPSSVVLAGGLHRQSRARGSPRGRP